MKPIPPASLVAALAGPRVSSSAIFLGIALARQCGWTLPRVTTANHVAAILAVERRHP